MGELKNEFSWSWSRHRTFHTCLRQYWYNHYAFWGGWDKNAPADVRELYIQKKLTSRPQWLGTSVHAVAEEVLGAVRRGRYPPVEEVVTRALRDARRAIENSENGLYRANPKRFPGFVDHYYGAPETMDWPQDLDELERQVRALFEHPIFRRLCAVPGRIVEIEELEQIDVGGVPVWVSLDVLVSDGDEGLVVIDWKTGKAHDAETVARQLGVYGLYVLDRYLGGAGAEPAEDRVGKVRGVYANTRLGDFTTVPLTNEHLSTTRSLIEESAAAMRERLADPAANLAREEDFPRLPEGAPECARCVFRRSCGREQARS